MTRAQRSNSHDTVPQHPPSAEKTPAKAIFWMLFPVLLLLASVVGWVFMISIAVDDPGFSVESDYYKKAANYENVIAQRAENERLGWSAEVSEFVSEGTDARLVLKVSNRSGTPVDGATVSALAFPTARGTQLQKLSFTALGDGRYRADLPTARKGLWEVRVQVKRQYELFTQTLRPELVVWRVLVRGRAV